MHLGKEIALFFGKYGIIGIIGIIISSIFMGSIIYMVLNLAKKEKIEQYKDLSKYLYKKSMIREIIQTIMNIFLLISFYVMIAGFSAYFWQELGIPTIIGSIIIATLSYITFIGNIDRLIKVNTFLIPILIISVLFLSIQSTNKLEVNIMPVIKQSSTSWITSAILYGSYNSIILIPILLSIQKKLTQKKQIKIVAITCTIILILLAICILALIWKIDININNIELPTVYIASKMGKIYQYMYGFIILVSIYTSAVSAGYGILENQVRQRKKIQNLSNSNVHKFNNNCTDWIFQINKPIVSYLWRIRNNTNINII